MNLKGGATIPAGAGVVVPVQLVQMNDYNWGSDAGEFNPYRFLAKAREGSDILLNKSFSGFVPTDSHDVYIVFKFPTVHFHLYQY